MPGAPPSSVIRFAALLACSTMMLFSPVARAQQLAAHKRVLVLYWYNKDHPWNVKFDHAFQTATRSAHPRTVEYFSEYLESNRFPGEKQNRVLRDYLKEKYADRPIDVVVANSDTSLNFLLKYRADLFPHAAIVFIATRRPTPEQLPSGRDVTGIINLSGQKKTVDLALKLHPGTRHVFVVSGTLAHDKKFETITRQQLRSLEGRVTITYLTDLPVHELIASMKNLPEHSVVLYVWQQSQDAPGTILESSDIFASIVQSTSVPIYGMTTSVVINGRGAIGGYIDTAESVGARAAELVLRIANGSRAQDIPVELATSTPIFDWRQLERWGIREDQLPPDAVVLFRTPTFWELYRWRIVSALSLVLLQAILIAFLLVERRRRRRAMSDLVRMAGRLIHVQDEERRRIARELHDENAQDLFAASLMLAKLRQRNADWTPEQVQVLEDCRRLVEVSIRGIRTLSYLLHPPFLDDAGLVSAVRWYVEGFVKRSDIPVESSIEEIGRLDAEVETALFRIVQEALTNIHRHSGGAKASIRMGSKDGQVVLEIKDNGHGIAAITPSESMDGIDALGVGIAGMRQRMRQLGGTLEVASSNKGTIVTVTVPMTPRAAHAVS